MSVMHKVEILRAACCVAGIDGETTDSERSVLTKLAGQIGVGEASLQAMINRAERDNSFCDEQFVLLKTTPDKTMQILLQVALADHKLTDDECTVLELFAGRLGLEADRFQRVLKQAKGELESRRDAADQACLVGDLYWQKFRRVEFARKRLNSYESRDSSRNAL